MQFPQPFVAFPEFGARDVRALVQAGLRLQMILTCVRFFILLHLQRGFTYGSFRGQVCICLTKFHSAVLQVKLILPIFEKVIFWNLLSVSPCVVQCETKCLDPPLSGYIVSSSRPNMNA